VLSDVQVDLWSMTTLVNPQLRGHIRNAGRPLTGQIPKGATAGQA